MVQDNKIRWLIFFVLGVMCVAIGAYIFLQDEQQIGEKTTRSAEAEVDAQPASVEETTDVEVIAQDLFIPWEIAVLPDGDLLVTERSGTLKKIGDDEFTIAVENIEHIGEGGLLGMALHPSFQNNRWIYLYRTTNTGAGLKNIVERYVLDNSRLSEKKVIVDNIPGATYHNGGRIAFGPDGFLYITTGDAQDDMLSQDTNSLAGKILRVGDDGSIPADNPFNSAVYSYGHRNPQGLAWDDQGRLWATEHGRSGLRSGFDELNRIEKGANYGWPVIQGDETRDGMKQPIAHSGPNDTWAPAGLLYMENNLYFTGLRGQAIYKAPIDPTGGISTINKLFHEEFGRLRVITRNVDGDILFATSNMDGRGDVNDGDDKIVKWVQ